MTAKFYFFDCGVTNTLAGIKTIDRQSDLYGKRLEQLIVNEVRAYNSYFRKHAKLSFWRDKHDFEVDLLINDDIAIEIKATARVGERDFRGLKMLQEEGVFKKFYLVSNDNNGRVHKGLTSLHYLEFLKKLWGGLIF